MNAPRIMCLVTQRSCREIPVDQLTVSLFFFVWILCQVLIKCLRACGFVICYCWCNSDCRTLTVR